MQSVIPASALGLRGSGVMPASKRSPETGDLSLQVEMVEGAHNANQRTFFKSAQDPGPCDRPSPGA
jgi:hypothetical protein